VIRILSDFDDFILRNHDPCLCYLRSQYKKYQDKRREEIIFRNTYNNISAENEQRKHLRSRKVYSSRE
jgi:hypothetical protein